MLTRFREPVVVTAAVVAYHVSVAGMGAVMVYRPHVSLHAVIGVAYLLLGCVGIGLRVAQHVRRGLGEAPAVEGHVLLAGGVVTLGWAWLSLMLPGEWRITMRLAATSALSIAAGLAEISYAAQRVALERIRSSAVRQAVRAERSRRGI